MLTAALCAAIVSMPAAAQWKWRDRTGVIQYSDVPPPASVPEADILQRPAPTAQRRVTAPANAGSAASAVLPAPKAGDPELEARRKKAEDDEAAKRKTEEDKIARQKLDNCTRARAYLKDLDEGLRIRRTNPKTGEVEYLDDKARAEEAQRARGVVAADCKP